jgi:Flp pilus assembly protein TadB
MQITLDTDDARARLHEIAGQAGEKAQEAAAEGRKRVQKRYGKRVRKLERKFERKLEHAARALPVDTPVDKHRRRRATKRSGGTFFILATLGGLAVAYFAWKRQQETVGQGPAPDAFGTAVDDSGNGRRQTATTHAPLS